MASGPVAVGGHEYLELVTTLLHRCRLEDPTAGLWEAADLQWWWRRDQHHDPNRAQFWLDDDGVPRVATVVTDWTDRLELDVIARANATATMLDDAWAVAVDVLARDARRAEMIVQEADHDTAARARAAGFAPTDDLGMTNWMDASARPAPEALPTGYHLASYAERRDRPHWMAGRSGRDVAARLAECSLYRPDLDLAVVTADDEVAAYGLFWADPVTRVGLVEPMRTEDAHQRRGLARKVLLAGLDRLAAAGCTRLKISFEQDNEAARRCYLGAGFVPHAPDRLWQLPSQA